MATLLKNQTGCHGRESTSEKRFSPEGTAMPPHLTTVATALRATKAPPNPSAVTSSGLMNVYLNVFWKDLSLSVLSVKFCLE